MASGSTGTTAINLHDIDFTFDAPFQLTLADGDVFIAEKVVRIVPKRRLVAFGEWQGKSVVAKLFFDSSRAKKHLKSEIKGIKIFQQNKIPTPDLYYEGMTADKQVQVILFERIEDAKNLEELWLERHTVKALMPELKAVILELATQHVLGVLQQDLHLKNFLLTEKLVYSLDGDQVELSPKILDKKQSMSNVALFLSQLGAGSEKYQVELYRYYAKARGWLIKTKEIRELSKLIKFWNDERWRRYEKKIFRECSDFVSLDTFTRQGMYDRNNVGSEFLSFIADPESVFTHPMTRVLKSGRSSTVVKVTIDHRELVVKRYNVKGLFHFLRRCFRKTRAATSWRISQKLQLFRVATATPVAFLEKRILGLRSTSYFVMTYIPGQHVGEFFDANDANTNVMVIRLVNLLKTLGKLGITHGDLKKTNILINDQMQPLLIDLDGTAEHESLASLRKAWRKETKRFLRNFDDQPALKEQFKHELS